jgi:signal transduction histidine kinase
MQIDDAGWFRRLTAAMFQRVGGTQPVDAGETSQPALPFEVRTARPSSGRAQSAGLLVLTALVLLGAAGVIVLAGYDRGPFKMLHVPERPVTSTGQAAAEASARRDAVVSSVESNLARRGDYQRWLDDLSSSFGRQTSGFQTTLNVAIRMGSGLTPTDRAALREAEAGVQETRTVLRARLADEDVRGAKVDAGLTKAEGVLAALVAASRSDVSSKPLADLTNRLAGARSLFADITRVKSELEAGRANLLTDVSRSLEMPSEPEQADATAFGPRLPVWPVTLWFLAVGALLMTATAFHARYLRHRTQQSLAAMRDVFRAVESGDQASRVEVSGTGLLAEVQTSLNDMLETLQLKVVSRVEHERTVSNLVESHEQTTRRERLAAADELAAGVVADLDERVASAVGFAEMARRHMGSPKLEHDLGALIDQLTEVGRVMRLLTKAPVREEMSMVHLNTLANEVADIARQHVWPKVDVSLRMAEGDHFVKGDAGRIRQAVLNLVSNARAAMPGGGQLSIEVGRLQSAGVSDGSSELIAQPDSLVLRVRDTGRGIPQAQLRTLFEPFDSTSQAAGAGLGLPQVAGIMAQHGGGVRVESQEGLGTTVSLLFPCVMDSAQQYDESVQELALAS